MTMISTPHLLTIILMLLMIKDYSDCCRDAAKSEGCRIVPGAAGTLECVCGMGCRRDFPFQSRNECEAQLIGSSSGVDVCSSTPCSNNGQCIQLKYGGYRCECAGTQHYGQYCQKGCSDLLTDENFPVECLVI
eukprot:GFUD01023202.1.p1 GENE.GFUD01023202.1~~GFUD01023202.1.p1  ORF type:complete len:133 (+),score=19.74 GFUD01023202.1:37-435(+)